MPIFFMLQEVGNHEDGYLVGIINLIQIFSELDEEQKIQASGHVTVKVTAAPDQT